MIFIKKIKLYVIFALNLIGYIQARSSSSQIGDVRIHLSDDKWICDQIQCPLDADRCYVSKSNEKSPSVLVRSNICYSKDNKVLKEKTSKTPINPNNKIKMHIVSLANGRITSYGEIFDEEKFGEELDPNLANMKVNLQHEMAGINQDMDNQMKELHENLKQMKENINKNMQNEMHNLQEDLSKMQYDLAHMFD